MPYLKVRVTPGARNDEVTGWIEDASADAGQGTLKIRIKAKPERGKANDALIAFLASKLALAPSQVTLRRGAGSRNKLVYVDGLSDAEIRERLDR